MEYQDIEALINLFGNGEADGEKTDQRIKGRYLR